ncbi:GPI transamidase component [Exophiala xenobiotica]|nr:GPI transamidase component [Exophiala xenobiotica]
METSSAPPPNAVATKKQPPPEKPEAVSLRTKIVISFWAVILVLGLPTWLQTTSIYRANLPLQDMVNWAEGLNTPAAIPLHIWVQPSGFPCSDAERLVRDTQQVLDDLNEYPTLHQRLHLVSRLSSTKRAGQEEDRPECGGDPTDPVLGDPALKIILEPAPPDAFEFKLDAVTATATVRGSGNNIPKQLANILQDLFKDEQITAALQVVSLASHSNYAQAFLKSQPFDQVTSIEKRISRAYKSSPEFHLTFSLFTASGSPSSWDVQEALKDHIYPLVQALSDTAQIDVTTQVQLYSAFSPAVQPVLLEERNGTFLQEKDLTAFVNAAEWPLAPSIGEGPTLNFILYVPSMDQIPLTIDGVEGTSWLIPQWGGIQILNPPMQPDAESGAVVLPAHLTKDILQQPFQTFSSQLMSLLGVSLSDGATKALPLQLRLDAYKRFSALTLYLKAASSLGSLSRLAQRLSNIPIPKNVAQLVDDTIGNLTTCCHAFQDSSWNAALSHAKVAYRDSEKAFFDKSMVGQVYFPDEHKVAVYLPLLGPVGVPLLVGLLREIKRFVSKRKAAPK